MVDVPNTFYRVSSKAVILDETRTKFLIIKEGKWWELPGGGLDWGTDPREELTREIKEEMNLDTTWIADHPSYFLTSKCELSGKWKAVAVYEATLKDINFTPTPECEEIAFVSSDEIHNYNPCETVVKFAKLFDPKNH